MKHMKHPANDAERDAAVKTLVSVAGYLCPICHGEKRSLAHINRGDLPHEWREVDCMQCSGVGRVTAEHMDRIRAGRAIREERVLRDMSLHEEAKRLGMSAAALSAIEWGRQPQPGDDKR